MIDISRSGRGGRKVSVFAVLAMVAVLVFTGIMTAVIIDRNKTADQQHYIALKEKLHGEVIRRVKVYQYGLMGTRGVYTASKSVERKEFRQFVGSLNLPQTFPAATGMGYIQYVPNGQIDKFLEQARADGYPDFHLKTLNDGIDMPDRMIIKYIEPVVTNHAAVGLDIGSEANRRSAAERAMLTGEASITERITLVQATGAGAGFLMLLPIYEQDVDPITANHRRATIRGWVYMTILAERIFAGTNDRVDGELVFKVYDGNTFENEHLLYSHENTGRQADTAETPGFHDTLPVEIGGREWMLVVNTTPKFKHISHASAWITGVGGCALAALLFMFLQTQNLSLNRAQGIARSMTIDLRRAASTDRLTGLPNRDLFISRLEEAIARSKSDPRFRFAVLFFDFDRFKVVNDSLGHGVGDALLISIAERFLRGIRMDDTAARFGGDEFVVLLNGITDDQEAYKTADRLLKLFTSPHDLMGHKVTSTASAGLVTNSQYYRNADGMLRDADAAMYQAKEAGKARYVVFDQVMHERAMERLELERDLQGSIERGELSLAFQPIVRLASGTVLGFEALARWEHPRRGVIEPEVFIPIAEDSGLIIPIGKWVFSEACRHIKVWNATPGLGQPITVSVNLSLRQVCHPDVVVMVREEIERSGIDPAWLKLEITESTIVDNRYDMIPLLEEIRGLGVKLAMDDFGTGHSSLSNLHKLPVDTLKIDQSFVLSMSANRELAAIMHSIITVSKHLGMTTVAEGIETADQIAMLQALDCDHGQGFYFQKPMPAERVVEYLKSQDISDAA